MARLVWDNETERKYTTGVSKGVFFDGDGKGHAWSGLISVTEKPQTNEPTAIYNSLGQKYDQYGNVAEKKHGLSCYTYPEAMDEFLGYEYLEEVGFSVDERPPKKFHMAYRVELGNDLYEIHVLLNQIATFGETNRSTLSNSPSLSTITMNLTGAADPRYGTSHIVLDSRLPITESAETILFGDKFNDSNINDFLEAEPTWETVAVNYAPIIEPDYDNMVWLGKENIISNLSVTTASIPPHTPTHHTTMLGVTVTDAYHIARLFPSYIIPVGAEVTISMSADIPDGRTTFRLFHQAQTNYLITNLYQGDDGIWYGTGLVKEEVTSGFTFNLYSGLSVTQAAEAPGDTKIHWIKVEAGNRATPWTPAPSDPDQKPRPTDPYPTNYKPGVKKYKHPPFTVKYYYDDANDALGVYKHVNSTIGYAHAALYLPYIGIGTAVKASATTHVRDVVKAASQPARAIALRQPMVYSSNLSFEPTGKVYIDSMVITDSPSLLVGANGEFGDYTVSYSDLFITLSGYQGEFFDANSTPPNKGTKYVRVETATHDYTLKQELRLRSKSRVRIYDQTSYDYWLEADDSQLIRQNETFTFSGPQAEITGDTFTIDDEILGSEGF